ncbi:MAG: hypothetical protein ACRDJJ_08000 [Actinomycetota bacterium]
MAQARTLEVVTREEILNLVEERPGPALSIFHPTDRVTVESEQNSLRLKNLIGKAHNLLAERGIRRPEIEELLEPVNSLLGNNDFWRHQLEGLALFRTPHTFRYYRLPFAVDELVVASHRLHVKPLLPALAGERHFYVLAISQHSVRLLRASRYGVTEVNLSDIDIPRSIEEALRYDDLQKPESKDHPTLAPSRSDTGPAAPSRGPGRVTRKHAFHGHGPGGEDQKDEILRFFQAVDHGIIQVLGTDHAPLVLASVDYLQPLYRQASHYRHILDRGIEGSPDRLSPAQLHERALQIVEPRFRAEIESAKQRYAQAAGTGFTSSEIHEVLRSAHQGRIEFLFIRAGEQMWGSYNLHNDELKPHSDAEPGDLDLLDLAAAQTLIHGGTAFLVQGDEMPDNQEVAALYRF